ncbi:acetylcholine receptor subunit alpha-like [Dreissena polymorpha]|uniref:acetylcholine receptor subunit alpha-like n=1 Tax=Dreissena polymorpha TaxID=45954 RepID=UPI002265191E|nr:acetylcholine receptor subunit alpha-like [Dreissena polymorpha]
MNINARLNDTKTLLRDLISNYNKNVRPVHNQSESVNVTVQLNVKSIQEFNEVSEVFSVVAAFSIRWKDERMTWNPANYGGAYQMMTSYDDVWVPELILTSPSDDVESLGAAWNRIRYFADGTAVWLPVALVTSTCTVDVEFYPLDTQTCTLSYIAMGWYDSGEVFFLPATEEVDITSFSEHPMWDLVETTAKSEQVGRYSQVSFSFKLKRRPAYVFVNVVLPILLLKVLNLLVFLLVPKSGERVSFCITVLLSIAVFMTIVSAMLPRTSKPVPIVTYRLIVDMVISAAITVVVILNLRIYSRETEISVPVWLVGIYMRRLSKAKNRNLRENIKSDQNTNGENYL